jgi:hypothetical protein
MTEDEKLVALQEAVARYLFIESKEVLDGAATIYRATALLLLGKPVDPELMRAAEHRALNDDALYSATIRDAEDLADLWLARSS